MNSDDIGNVEETQFTLFEPSSSLKRITEESEKQEQQISESSTCEEYQPKTIILNTDENFNLFETAHEIRYSSVHLDNFPIKFTNLPLEIQFKNSFVIGDCIVKIGEENLNCYLTYKSNNDITFFEIKNREFKLGLSVILNKDTIEFTNNYFSLELSQSLNHIRATIVLETLEKIFLGTPITFNKVHLNGNLIIESFDALIRIRTLLELFKLAQKCNFKIQMNKLENIENIFYKINLLSLENINSEIETWCNFEIDNFKLKENKLSTDDSLIIKRRLPFKNKITIEETITIKDPIHSFELREGKVLCRRKKCSISLLKLRGE